MKRSMLIATVLMSATALAQQELPVYPGTVHTRIGGDLLISGEHYRMAYFTTADSMTKVGKYFHQEWKRRGYPTTVDGDGVNELTVSAFFTREGLVRSVVLRRHGDKTVGFTALKDLWVREPVRPAPAMVPLEGTLFAQDLSSRDAESPAQLRSMLVKGSVDATRANLDKKLAESGYKQLKESASRPGGSLILVVEYERGSEHVLITLSEVDESVTVVAQTWMNEQEPAK
jgi:hypothetical protein